MTTKNDIMNALYALGIRRGDYLFVHSSLSSLGHVYGGAQTVIDSLCESVGQKGLIVMPTFASKDEVFDAKSSTSGLGKVPDLFWRNKDVFRSMHPTHSVAAWGHRAKELIDRHEAMSDPYGEGTPYMKFVCWRGKILLLGVDLDRCTLLHTAEALVNAPYLSTVREKYKDRYGDVHEVEIMRIAGPHRDFLKLNKPFLREGIMKKGKIGNGVSRVIDAHKMIQYTVNLMKLDMDLMLCSNPSCMDCRKQRRSIRQSMLENAGLKASMSVQEVGKDFREVLESIQLEGFTNIELNYIGGKHILECDDNELEWVKNILDQFGVKVAGINFGKCSSELIGDNLDIDMKFDELFGRAIKIGKHFNTTNLIFSISPAYNASRLQQKGVFQKIAKIGEKARVVFLLENLASEEGNIQCLVDAIKNVDSNSLKLCFNPAHYAQMGGRPFLDVFVLNKLKWVKRYLGAVRIEDAKHKEFKGYTDLAKGNAEIKELISALVCRGYKGIFTLSDGIKYPANYRDYNIDIFWDILEEVT